MRFLLRLYGVRKFMVLRNWRMIRLRNKSNLRRRLRLTHSVQTKYDVDRHQQTDHRPQMSQLRRTQTHHHFVAVFVPRTVYTKKSVPSIDVGAAVASVGCGVGCCVGSRPTNETVTVPVTNRSSTGHKWAQLDWQLCVIRLTHKLPLIPWRPNTLRLPLPHSHTPQSPHRH